MTEDTPRIIGADEVCEGQRVEWRAGILETFVYDVTTRNLLVTQKRAEHGGVYLVSDAPTEDVSFSISSAAEMFTDPAEDGASGGQDDRAPDGSRIVKWITEDRYEDEFGCVWKAPTEDPAPTYEEMWRDMLRERDALAATLKQVRERCNTVPASWDAFSLAWEIRRIVDGDA